MATEQHDVATAWRLAAGEAQEAAAALGLQVVAAGSAAECEEIVDLFNRVWEVTDESDVIDLSTLVALAHAGHYVVQARLDGRLVGGGVGFVGASGETLHSHIVGVLRTLTVAGVGRVIKLHQRSWCLERGLTRMSWTYDPLVARNAHFNIRKLGALPVSYHEDFYGRLKDGVNAGQFSDRMLVEWDLTAPVPAAASRPAQAGDPATVRDGIRDDGPDLVALTCDGDEPTPFTPPPAHHDGDVLVGVPRDIEEIRHRDPALAARWRRATREALGQLLDDGWTVRDFRAGHYVLGTGGDR